MRCNSSSAQNLVREALQSAAINTAFARALRPAGDVELYAGDNLPSDTAASTSGGCGHRSGSIVPTDQCGSGLAEDPPKPPSPLPSGVNWRSMHPLTDRSSRPHQPGRADRCHCLRGTSCWVRRRAFDRSSDAFRPSPHLAFECVRVRSGCRASIKGAPPDSAERVLKR